MTRLTKADWEARAVVAEHKTKDLKTRLHQAEALNRFVAVAESLDAPPSTGRVVVETCFALRRALKTAAPEARIVLLRFLVDGYCTDCGSALKPHEVCHCENDE